jgi:acetolactate synthase-1/2/3 large subunit
MEACGPIGYKPPDFTKIARAYNLPCMYITSNNTKHIRNMIKNVLKVDSAVICDINSDEFHKYEPRVVGWKTPIEDMYPYIDRKEFKENMIIEIDKNYNYMNPPEPPVKID